MGDNIKKIILIIVFLIPVYISSFYKTTFFNTNKNNKIVYIKDRDLYLDIDDYIIGVVSAEMPMLFHEEALKAQAIASRSYLLSSDSDIYVVTTSNQAFLSPYELKNKWNGNYYDYYKKISTIVKNTSNEVITRDNKILKTYYFSMSNGYTENSINVFNNNLFKSVKSLKEEELPNFKKTITIDIKEFKNKLNVNNIKDINIKRNNTNHVSNITIDNKSYTGIEFRKLFNLRSTDFEIDIKDKVYITTKGYGHGVGMSQYGANIMAKDGYSYKDILTYYYQDTKIIKL